jgi:predicted transcriptional regulator
VRTLTSPYPTVKISVQSNTSLHSVNELKQQTHSQTVLARQVGISQSAISRILKANKFHPYHLTSVQDLTEDRQKNVSCTFLLNKQTVIDSKDIRLYSGNVGARC